MMNASSVALAESSATSVLKIKDKSYIAYKNWRMAKINSYSGSRIPLGWPYVSVCLQGAIKEIHGEILSVEVFSCNFLFVTKQDLN
eukprot:3467976-Ditylum_brightwellii.AAC.1